MSIFHFTPATYTLDACLIVKPGDVMEFESGEYINQTIGIRVDNVTLRGLPSNGVYPHFKTVIPAGQVVGPVWPVSHSWPTLWSNKAICLVRGKNAWIEGIEFSGCKAWSTNGAGIRHESLGIVVRNCKLHDNENGFLGSEHEDDTTPGPDGGLVWVEGCELYHNGAGDGQSHNIYTGFAEAFVFKDNYSHAANIGHLCKGKAWTSIIVGNRFDTGDGSPSFAIDVDGGNVLIADNTITKTAAGKGENLGTVINYYLWHQHNPNILRVLRNKIRCPINFAGTFVRVRDIYDAKNTTGLAGTTGHVDVTIADNVATYTTALNAKGAPSNVSYRVKPWVAPANAVITGNTLAPDGSEPPGLPVMQGHNLTPDNLAAFIAANMPIGSAPVPPPYDEDTDPVLLQKIADLQAKYDADVAALQGQVAAMTQVADDAIAALRVKFDALVAETARATTAEAKLAAAQPIAAQLVTVLGLG